MTKPRQPQVIRGPLLRGPAGAFFLALVLAALATGAICTWSGARWIGKPFPGFLVNQRMALSNVGHYAWTGTAAGLAYPDKILAADGRKVTAVGDLRAAVEGRRPGDVVEYEVARGGETVRVAVPVMRFGFLDFMISVGNYLLTGLAYLLLATVVLLLKPESRAGRAFFLACFFLGLNDLTNMDMVTSQFGFVWVYLLSGVFLPAAGVHLAMLFPEEQRFVRRRPGFQLVPYLAAAVIAAPVELLYPGPVAVALYSNLVPLYGLVAALALLAASVHAFRRGETALARQRARVVFLGVAIAFPLPAAGMILSNLGTTVAGVGILNNFFFLPFLLFPAAIGYAIARHDLFDVDVYIKRAVGYALMTAIVGTAYAGVQVLFGPAVLRPLLGDWAGRLYPALFALLVVFLFSPVNRRVQAVVDRVFYRRKLDYRATVTGLSEALATVLDLEEIIRRVVGSLREEMFLDQAGVVLLPQREESCRAVLVRDDPGGGGALVSESCLAADDPLVALLEQRRGLVTEYDLAEDERLLPVREAAGRRFAELGVSLALPIVFHERLTGILVVGRKKSGHFYTREDLHLLETLANHAAVAIQNARLAGQMKREEVVRTNLTRYLSPQFVEKIVNDDLQLNLGGTRKTVTVLFSDIRNFTSITETRPPDELVSVLNEYFTSMAACVFENQGSIDKYIGDAIMAVFGSLIPLAETPRSAVAAAIEMMNVLPERNRHWAQAYHGFEVRIGIGITTGEVFLGNIGSPERMEYTVIGDTVNVASRFSGLAKAGQILVDRATLDALGGAYRHQELPPMSVKGKSEKMQVFEILYR